MKQIFTLLACLLTFAFAKAQSTSSFHSLSAVLLDGSPVNMSQYYGKKLMVVNVASFCAYTPQFEELETLYEQYRSNNFEIIGFPCNDYGRQGGSDSDLINVCSSYNVSFPITQTVSIENNPIHPVYAWLTQQSLNGVSNANVSWNFNKFLIDEAGNWVAYYNQNTLPNAPAIVQWILSPSVINSVGEAENENGLKLLSSNPASSSLEMEWSGKEALQAFSLISAEGRELKRQIPGEGHRFSVDVADLSPGIYTGKWNTARAGGFMRILIAR